MSVWLNENTHQRLLITCNTSGSQIQVAEVSLLHRGPGGGAHGGAAAPSGGSGHLTDKTPQCRLKTHWGDHISHLAQ